MNDTSVKIYLAGHKGLVGSAILRELQAKGYHNIIVRNHGDLDLTRQEEVEAFFKAEKPDWVFLSAARVGGILANSTYPAEFLYNNLMIGTNIVHAAYKSGVTKLLNLGSSCIYPKMAPQPLKEDYLLTGSLEPTNEAYALAKIAIIRLCKHYNDQYGTNFISAMPTNMYGPGDNFDLQGSHVLPAMIRKFHEAKLLGKPLVLWGDGSPYREFLYADDLARALVFLMENSSYKDIGEFINVGSGVEISISNLAKIVAKIVGYTGDITWDASKPNGTPRKLMDSGRLFDLGWQPAIDLEQGIKLTYDWFLHKAGQSV